MQQINDLLSRQGANGTSKPSETTLQPSTRKKITAACWQVLLGRRLVTDPVGSDAFRVFEMDIADLTEAQLKTGLDLAKDFTEFFTIPAFRKLCLTDYTPNHPMYKALPKEVYIPADESVAKANLAKMKALLV